MIFQIFNKDILKILTVFCLSPGSKVNRNDLKGRTRLNNINLDKGINALLNSGVIAKEKRLLMLNFENKDVKEVIRIVSGQYTFLKEIPMNVYFSVVDTVFFMSKFRGIDVYLFGSFAKLVFKESSDVDIAIVSDKIDRRFKKEIGKFIRKVELRYGKEIEVHYFGKKFYKSKKDLLVKDILKNGVRLI